MASKEPLNIELLKVDSSLTRLVPVVSSMDIYESASSTSFHPNGLFSTEIFGRVGDPNRDFAFARIPLKTTILHPVVWQRLIRIKALYGEILTGKAYAVWDNKLSDFVASNELDGSTGYQFFMEHWDKLMFQRSAGTPKGDVTTIRNMRIALIEKYKEEALTNNILVMPAGLRDVEVDALGRTKEGEVNPLYRKIMGIANTIADTYDKNTNVLDNARVALQKTFNEIYDKIETMLKDKNGFLQSKWASRRITNGTRNVISAMTKTPTELGLADNVSPNDTIVGLWQTTRGALPITRVAMEEFILNEVFQSVEGSVQLIDKKTLKLTSVNVSMKSFDLWTTKDGLDKVVNLQKEIDLRHAPVDIDGYYLALVYRPKDKKVFKVFRDIDDLPEWADKKDVHPITLMELIYLSGYKKWNQLKILITRYPVAGEGSIYASNVRVATTVKSVTRRELSHDWTLNESDDTNYATAYPDFKTLKYVDSLVVANSRLAGLGGDYDGDMVSGNILYTKETIAEVNRHFTSTEAYIDPAGGLRASASDDIMDLVMFNMTAPAVTLQ